MLAETVIIAMIAMIIMCIIMVGVMLFIAVMLMYTIRENIRTRNEELKELKNIVSVIGNGKEEN